MFKMRDLQTGMTANNTFQQVQQLNDLIAEQQETNRLLRELIDITMAANSPPRIHYLHMQQRE